jgi:RNA polymerase sigma factor (sigma-70 family)
MPGDSLQSVVQYLHRIIDVGPGAASDAELLDRFATRRDESAFALLVYRHGPMILGVCQRVLRHEHDSEDVFQATFLTLARRANSISKKDSLASWLYKVAFRIACRARGKAPMLTNQAALQGQSEPDADVIWRDLRPVLDQEIAQLPESQSRPIILCYLEGKTHEEAAELLGWPKGTLAARLARGRERLRQRLTRRGWTLSAAALAAVLADKAGATAISAELMRSTVQAALAYVSGTSVAVLSAKAVALAEGVMQMMWYSKVKMAVVMLLAVALTGSGVGWAMHHAVAGGQGVLVQKAEAAGDAKTEIAALKAEIAKLRAELAEAMKEIKNAQGPRLGIGVRQPEPLYAGKPLSFYLEQFKDRDPGYRAKAIPIIANFAEENKELIPLLVTALRDDRASDSDKVGTTAIGDYAAMALSQVGPDVIPAVIDVLKSKGHMSAQSRAAAVLGHFGAKAKTAVPDLIAVLKDDLNAQRRLDESVELRRSIVEALGEIGPNAKSGIPLIVDTFFRRFDEIEANAKKHQQPFGRFVMDFDWDLLGKSIIAIVEIDPDVETLIPGPRKLGMKAYSFQPRIWGPNDASPADIEAAVRKAREVFEKRYKTQK